MTFNSYLTAISYGWVRLANFITHCHYLIHNFLWKILIQYSRHQHLSCQAYLKNKTFDIFFKIIAIFLPYINMAGLNETFKSFTFFQTRYSSQVIYMLFSYSSLFNWGRVQTKWSLFSLDYGVCFSVCSQALHLQTIYDNCGVRWGWKKSIFTIMYILYEHIMVLIYVKQI